ncbi:MAG: type II CRISPR-associated endonuclease Cas1, partial [Chitinophagaceae bacterium]|nr:type II CRISPR-associated endonuclease Cas1 [Chitinophagaceae bacterium]
MIKRTLYFGNPAYLKTSNEQLIIEMQDSGETKQAPIEDIGLLILDHQQIIITHSVIAKLLENNVAFITCDHTHHPTGLMLNLDGHTLQSQKFQAQIEASAPLKKQLWQQTVEAKIDNQAKVLQHERTDNKYLLNLAKSIKSGDSDNSEAKAAAYYWKHVFPDFLEFKRERYGLPPNNLLN